MQINQASQTSQTSQTTIELVGTWPQETDLQNPDIVATAALWLDMFRNAEQRIEIAAFYLATAPGSAMEPILAALEAAVARGVRVRLLIDAKFYLGQPEVADRLAAAGIDVHSLDLSGLGGVMHAKYFVVDGRAAYIGSANFDWRSLAHIHELGVHLCEPALVAATEAIWNADWANSLPIAAIERNIANPSESEEPTNPPSTNRAERAGAEETTPPPPALAPFAGITPVSTDYAGSTHRITVVASPRDRLPDPAIWDLPRLLGLIAGARHNIQIQLLSFALVGYDGVRFEGIERALKAAAKRGVIVELLVADWNKRPPALADLQALQREPGIHVRMATIPPARSGFIPYARVIHSKFLLVDGRFTWIGSSNFSGDYFFNSRNLGVIVEGTAFAADVGRVFAKVWNSAYAYDLDPEAQYDPPQVAPEPPPSPAPQSAPKHGS